MDAWPVTAPPGPEEPLPRLPVIFEVLEGRVMGCSIVANPLLPSWAIRLVSPESRT